MQRLDKSKLYTRMIFLCIFILALFSFIKVTTGFGVGIHTDNQTFVAFGAFVESNVILWFCYDFCLAFITLFLLWTTILIPEKIDKTYLLYAFATVFSGTVIKSISPPAGLIYDFISMIVIPYYFGKCVKNTITANVMFVVVSFLSMLPKDLEVNAFAGDSPVTAFLFSLDVYISMFILCLIAYEKGGVYKWVDGVSCGCLKRLRSLKLVLKPKELKIMLEKWNESNISLQVLKSNISWRNKILFCLSKYGSDAVIYAMITIFSIFTEKMLEAVVLFVCYASLRYVFPTTYHTTPFKCTVTSIVVFCMALHNVMPVATSLLWSVVIALIVDAGLWMYADRLNLLKRYFEDFTRFGFTGRTARIAHDWKIGGLDGAELMDKYGLSQDALDKAKFRINKKLNSADVQ